MNIKMVAVIIIVTIFLVWIWRKFSFPSGPYGTVPNSSGNLNTELQDAAFAQCNPSEIKQIE